MEQYMRNFLWETTQQKRKFHLVNWKFIMMPKDIGGLAIQNRKLKNEAPLASLSWSLFNTLTLYGHPP